MPSSSPQGSRDLQQERSIAVHRQHQLHSIVSAIYIFITIYYIYSR
jgi:hypothetical protein